MLRLLHCALLLIAPLLLSGCAATVRVEWSTESEVNTAGFNLYRSESPDGPFDVKVNAQIIPPSADPVLGGDYRFVDTTARPGKTYYYQLQEIEKSGAANFYGPVESHASGLDWRHALILGALGGMVIFLWLRGGRRSSPPR